MSVTATSRPRRVAGPSLAIAAVAAAVVGVLWGVTCAWGDTQDSKFIQGLVNTAGPWLILAFVFGMWAKGTRDAAVVGGLVLIVSLGAYHVAQTLGERATNTRGLLSGPAWLPVALAAGAAYGGLGRISQERSMPGRIVAVCALAGLLVAESLVLLLNQGRFEVGAVSFLIVEMVVGIAAPMLLLSATKDRAVVLGLLASAATAAYIVDITLIDTVRERLSTR